jgi:hypothetical protein
MLTTKHHGAYSKVCSRGHAIAYVHFKLALRKLGCLATNSYCFAAVQS